MKIFISYRREDSRDICGRITDRLTANFGRDSVFIDVDSIPFGADFREYIDSWIKDCDTVLVVIGRRWHGVSDTPEPRIWESTDLVRIEVEAALAAEIPVIPVLVGGASMPLGESLPLGLQGLVFRQAVQIDSDFRFHQDVDRLVEGLTAIGRGTSTGARQRNPKQETTTESQDADSVLVMPFPRNLDFEELNSMGYPVGWFNGAGVLDGASPDYLLAPYPVEIQKLRTISIGHRLQFTAPLKADHGLGCLMQRCPAERFIGKMVTLTLFTKMEQALYGANAELWLRLDSGDRVLVNSVMPLKDSADWQEVKLSAAVSAESKWINFGVLLHGVGKLKIDSMSFLCD